jgi:hypothetical protein
MAHSDGRHSDGEPALSGHCRHGWTCSLPRPVAIDTGQLQGGTVKGACTGTDSARSLCGHGCRLHPDCRAVLIQFVALQTPEFNDSLAAERPNLGSGRQRPCRVKLRARAQAQNASVCNPR